MTTLTTSQTTTSALGDSEIIPTRAEMDAMAAAARHVDAVELTKDLVARFQLTGQAASATAVLFMDGGFTEFFPADGRVWYIEPDRQIRGGVVYIMEDDQ